MDVSTTVRPSANYQLSNSSGSFSTTSTSAVDVTNLSISITTSGRPVVAQLVLAGGGTSFKIDVYSSSFSALGTISFVRDSTILGGATYAVGGPGSLSTVTTTTGAGPSILDTPAAGTYTYKVRVNVVSGSTMEVNNARLLVYEL